LADLRAAPGRRVRAIAIGASVVAVLALAVFATIRVRQAQMPPVEAPAIAVLPFENVGRKGGEEFADGMTEEITNRLSALHGLRVIGKKSAQSYAGTTKTPKEIASELGVKYVLTGTVRWDKAADGKILVRVSPSLLRTDDATQLWAEAYQTVLSGMFDVQAKVASEVATALNITLLEPDKTALASRPTDNLDAYGLYLQAKALLENAQRPAQIREAIALLEKATAADPKFLLGWTTLSIANTELHWSRGDLKPTRLEKARAALDKAAFLDYNSPDFHIARGVYLFHGNRDYDGAISEFTLAEAARPSDNTIQTYKSAIARRQGKWNEAVASQKKSLELEPRNGAIALDIAGTLLFMRRYAEAEEYADRGMALEPDVADGPMIKSIIAASVRGNLPESIQHLRDAVPRVQPHSALTLLLLDRTWPAVEDPSLRRMLLESRYSPDLERDTFYAQKALLFVYTGETARARAYADTAVVAATSTIRNSPETPQAYVNLAMSNAILGNRDEALRALAQADEAIPRSKDAYLAAERDDARPMLFMLLGDQKAALTAIEQQCNTIGKLTPSVVRLDPIYAPLRADPRFQRLIQGS
jgi:TolB-like protein/predicted Zn-dependent protease